ncbi:MAG TPA: ATP-binding protein [Chitinophagaceae bacterium]
MKKPILILILSLIITGLSAQDENPDSLKDLLANSKNDTERISRLDDLFWNYLWSFPDSSLTYLQQEVSLASQLESDTLSSLAFLAQGWYYLITGSYLQALHADQEELRLAEKSGNFLWIAKAYDALATFYSTEGDYDHAIYFSYKAKNLMDANMPPHFSKLGNQNAQDVYIQILHGLGTDYAEFNHHLDSALFFEIAAYDAYIKMYSRDAAAAEYVFGNIYLKMSNYQEALKHYRIGANLAKGDHNKKDFVDNCNGLANTFKALGNTDSSIYYANEVILQSGYARYLLAKAGAASLLAGLYLAKKNIDSAFKYLGLTIALNDSLFNKEKLIQLQSMTFNEQQRQQDIEAAKRKYENQIRTFGLVGVLFVFFLITFFLWRNNRHRQKAFAILQKQKQEIDIQKTKVEKTLEELKTTQAQLIQSEKMASLGEMTAGIAHEIQNPLNFVNNFSEVNRELIEELKSQKSKLKSEEQDEILNDIDENLEKISHHGKRADIIVKGMLQHSRASSGKKEPADINALCDEYLRLSYHGMRAKDKTFNAKFETDFDNSIGKINIVPQDIGRVILNLINNAFYAVSEKQKTEEGKFEPCVTVQTKKLNDKVEIRVADNGNGIPQNVVDKIFQPFFTTKPTGQGTGLGLSLAYDIVKAHGGEIKVESKEGEGTEFIIQLKSDTWS